MNDVKTDDKRAAESWSSDPMPVAEGEAGTRVLDQSAIDNLLGFDADHPDGEGRGVLALVNSGLVNYERLPMLDVVFDRLVRMLSTSLRNLTSDNVEVTLDQIASVRFGDYLGGLPMPALITVFRAEEWDNYGLLTVDSALIYSVVDVLLGGRRGTAAMRIEGRPYTTIERNIVERMLHVVLADLTAAFDPISAVTFKFDRLETNPRFATITRANNAAVLVKIRIDMDDRGGRLDLLIPYATLEPVRELLLQMFMGEKFGRDSIWGKPPDAGTLPDRDGVARRAGRKHRQPRQRAELEGRHAHHAEQCARRACRNEMRRPLDVRRPHRQARRTHRGKNNQRSQAGEHAMNNAVIIDLVTIVVMCFAVFYAARLNRALSRARDGRSELAQLIVSLTEAHTKAEAAIKNMKTTAAEYDAALQKQITVSRGLADELMLINESSNALANRMERLAPLARGSFEAAYREGEEQPRTQVATTGKTTLRAERPVSSGEPAKAKTWPGESSKKAETAPPPRTAQKNETQRSAASAASAPNVRNITEGAEDPNAPRSRAEQELFAAIETLRKGR